MLVLFAVITNILNADAITVPVIATSLGKITVHKINNLFASLQLILYIDYIKSKVMQFHTLDGYA